MSAPNVAIPSAGSVMLTLMGVTWRRLVRGRALWVSLLIAMLPVTLAAVLRGGHNTFEPVAAVQFLVLVLLPPMFVASSLGEEIEDRTTTYLWSRPIARWTIVASKLLALTPIAMILIVGGLVLSHEVWHGAPAPAQALLALAAGTIAVAALAAGLATLVPKHGMALSIVYLIVFDLPLGAIPASLNSLSITHQVQLLVEDNAAITQPAITLAIITVGWLAGAFKRIQRLEY